MALKIQNEIHFIRIYPKGAKKGSFWIQQLLEIMVSDWFLEIFKRSENWCQWMILFSLNQRAIDRPNRERLISGTSPQNCWFCKQKRFIAEVFRRKSMSNRSNFDLERANWGAEWNGEFAFNMETPKLDFLVVELWSKDRLLMI
jgi:hypothetical protein